MKFGHHVVTSSTFEQTTCVDSEILRGHRSPTIGARDALPAATIAASDLTERRSEREAQQSFDEAKQCDH